MSVDVIMPKLGESITEGTILEWKKEVGDSIEKDETLLEISTDKVDSEVPSPAKGKISEILYKVNDTVSVGETIARIAGDGETVSKQEKPEVTHDDKAEKTIEKKEINSTKIKDKVKSNRFYSPLVKSIASKEGISLSELEALPGSGANNRVNKNDILNYINNKEGSAI